MKIAAIIPARMESTRFPGKPLAKICDIPMIEHVRRRVSLCKKLDYVIVATCDEEIYSTVTSNNGQACMTSNKHIGCTDRIAEASKNIDADIIINVQGDEPMIMPDMIDDIIKIFDNEKISCVNLISYIKIQFEFENHNVIKTVIDKNGRILYFSRSPIPSKWNGNFNYYKQVGMIGFKKDLLFTFNSLKPTPLEIIESIDMLRLLEHGYSINASISNYTSYGVDTTEDLIKVNNLMKKDFLYNKYK